VGHAGDQEVSWKGVGVGVGERGEKKRVAPDPLRDLYPPSMHLLQTENDKSGTVAGDLVV
jgi:hypothetical protein